MAPDPTFEDLERGIEEAQRLGGFKVMRINISARTWLKLRNVTNRGLGRSLGVEVYVDGEPE